MSNDMTDVDEQTDHKAVGRAAHRILLSGFKVLRERLEPHFSPETAVSSAPADPPSSGHCAVVSTIAAIVFDMGFVSTCVEGYSHWFNRICTGPEGNRSCTDVDLTGDQFGRECVTMATADELWENTKVRRWQDLNTDTLERAILLAERAGIDRVVRTLRLRCASSFLFLDVDGVLNTQAYHESLGDVQVPWEMDTPTEDDWRKMIDVEAVSRLNRIVDATGCEIVLSSTWRIGYGSASRMQDLLETLGFEGYIVGETPQTFSGSRGREIRCWLEEHYAGQPYVILDDADLSVCEGLEKRWVQTHYDGEGLGEEQVQKAIDILSSQDPVKEFD